MSTTSASSAMSGVMVSFAGEAVTRFPATVPRVRSCGAPTSQHACASGSARSRQSREATTSLWVVSAPSEILPSWSSIRRKPGIAVMSISVVVGLIPRESSTTTSVPPATMRALPACSASSASASGRDRGCR